MELMSLVFPCVNRVVMPVAGSVEITVALCRVDKFAAPAKTAVVELVEIIVVFLQGKQFVRRVRRHSSSNAVIESPLDCRLD